MDKCEADEILFLCNIVSEGTYRESVTQLERALQVVESEGDAFAAHSYQQFLAGILEAGKYVGYSAIPSATEYDEGGEA